MKYKRLRLSAIFVFGLGLAGLMAQTSINTTGGNTLGTGSSVSYSVGQVFHTTNTGMNGSVSNGVQQPYEISSMTGLENIKGISLSIYAHPNPVTDFLLLKIESIELKNLSFQLFDTQGKLLRSEKIISNQSIINMSNLISSTYFVKVISEKKSIKEFKIIKN